MLLICVVETELSFSAFFDVSKTFVVLFGGSIPITEDERCVVDNFEEEVRIIEVVRYFVDNFEVAAMITDVEVCIVDNVDVLITEDENSIFHDVNVCRVSIDIDGKLIVRF